MLQLVMVLAMVVMLALGAGEIATDAVETGYVMQNNDARLAAAYGSGE